MLNDVKPSPDHALFPSSPHADSASRERRLLRAIELCPTATVLLDARTGGVLEASPALGRILGRPVDDILGKTAEGLGFNLGPPARGGAGERLAAGLSFGPVDFALPRADGDVAFVSAEWHPVDGGAIAAFVTDITERKRSEIAMRRSDERFQRFFRSCPIPVSICRLDDGAFVEVNDAWIMLFGFLREDVIGKSGIELGIWPDPAERARFVAGLTSAGFVRGHDTRLRRRTGAFADVTLAAELIEVVGERCILWSTIDATRQKLAERELRSLNQTLEERIRRRTADLEVAYRELEAFTHAVSHDLRAPARRLQSFAQLLLEALGGDATGEVAHLVGRIRGAGERIGTLMDALLDLSRVARRELSRQDVNLSALAASVLDELRASDPQRAVETAVQPGLTAFADPGLARSLLENVLGNAWKYTSRVAAPRIEFGCVARDGEAAFYVRDNGCGFDMAYADKLFHPFSRLHSEKEFEGAGIGLAAVARIVARHGGRVWADSLPGAGATFHFTLPAAA